MSRGAKPGERRGGRQKGSRNKITANIQELAREYGPEALKTLAQIMGSTSAPPQARAMASNSLLDRGYGKPPQFSTGDAEQFRRAVEMSDDELAGIAAGSGSHTIAAPIDPQKLN